MNVAVLRLGHRFERDKRISTHLALVSRALGAEKIVFDAKDLRIKKSVDAISDSWGGKFKIKFTDSWRNCIRDFKGVKVHLTMYGININDIDIAKLKARENIMVIVGGKKVPSDVYELSDYNIAVGSQPHSEVAALSVFLDRLFEGDELEKDFEGRQRIVPQESGKKVEKV
ncbi:tRNA (cytidine(56)-2'-O)-methyltransferase [Candidatus Altiarchaeales archaeon WOR_SM1_SCG]|nr:tRNA (cytidine(56)-2'-O)-methyltransferase [Candidatus Altiarchaeales archaeon WOR_SM1_SCG]